MKSDNVGRRRFLTTAAATGAAISSASAGLGAAGAPAFLRDRSPSDRIGVACVGVGTRGHQLLTMAQEDPKVDVHIICDLYKGNIERAKKLCKHPDVRVEADWEKACTDSSVDAVIIGTPDFWHAPQAIAAAKAKKDIYLEKGLCMNLKEAKAIRKAVRDNSVVFQLGHHYNSEPTYHKAREIFRSGALGKVTTVRTYMDRTGPTPFWKFYTMYHITEMPADAGPDTIDWDRFIANAPKRPFDAERFFTWRCWWDYGRGVAGDLMSHMWDGVNMIMGLGIPETATAQGGIYFWKGDRDVPDTWHVTFDYPSQELVYTFGGAYSNVHVSEQTLILGREKTLAVAPWYCRTYDAEWKPENRKRLTEARNRMAEATGMPAGDLPFPPEYSYKRGELTVSSHVQDFLDCMRTRETPRCGMDRAFEAGVAIAMSVEAWRRERKVRWDKRREEIV
jgi:predicted dehydrogenase